VAGQVACLCIVILLCMSRSKESKTAKGLQIMQRATRKGVSQNACDGGWIGMTSSDTATYPSPSCPLASLTPSKRTLDVHCIASVSVSRVWLGHVLLPWRNNGRRELAGAPRPGRRRVFRLTALSCRPAYCRRRPSIARISAAMAYAVHY
jgi:hypothetical protein